MLIVNLRKAMAQYQMATGEKLTYQTLAEGTGISINTLQSVAARPGYNTNLSTIETLCTALECKPGDILELLKSPDGD